MFSNDVIVSITINGGHPWGFSIKGGSKSNKPLVISKVNNIYVYNYLNAVTGNAVCCYLCSFFILLIKHATC